MEDQAKVAVAEWDDWPTEEPGYGMPTVSAGARAAPPEKAELRTAATLAAPAPDQTPADAASARPALIFPCHARPHHFPELFARSGLFSGQRQPRAAPAQVQALGIKGQMHHSVDFNGPRLSMNDKAVYEAVVRLAKTEKHDLGLPLHSSLRAIADEMGWSARGGRDLDWVWGALERLAQSEVSFQLANGSRVSGKLLESVKKGTIGIEISFDSRFVLAAFGEGQQFKIDSERRRFLGSPLAQWLHDFLSTHREGHALTLSYLQELCGSEATSKRFCHALQEAATKLCAAAPELAKGFDVDKSRRSSKSWTITFERGSEACDFFRASDFKRQLKRAEKSARQRGLEL